MSEKENSVKPISGGTLIDRESTEIKRVKLNEPSKEYLHKKLIPLIENTTISINSNRTNSGKGRSQVFGYGSIRGKGYGEFANNRNHPELYRALLIFGKKIVPSYIPFTAIQVNHNYKTKKHIDKANIGLSLAVSFGDFTGGELVIDGVEYQTKEHPVIFNGALFEHYNKPIKGNRYSLVYFVSAPPHATLEEIKDIQSKLFKNVKETKGEGLMSGIIEGSGLEQYSDIHQAQKMTNEYFGKPTKLYVSDKPSKKYYVLDPDGKKHYFGAMGFSDFTKHKDPVRRRAYLARARKIKGNWLHDKYSPNNLAINILW